MTPDLFESEPVPVTREEIGAQAVVLRGLARPYDSGLIAAVEQVCAAAPFRQMVTPGGRMMSIALTNCGKLGWTSDRHGYRYAHQDPQTGRHWPPLPAMFRRLAAEAAALAGFASFEPDACLINRYLPGTRLSLHQDRDELDHGWPIVSVSLGVPAVFLFGGHARSDKAARVLLRHGDVVVWGGVDRLRFHGVLPMKPAHHPLLGEQRINLTLRHAG